MLDVGAMFGESSMPFLMNGWTVYAFEPDIDGVKSGKLSEISKRFKDFQLDNRAVSDVSGNELEFFVSEESKGISSTIKFSDHHNASHKVTTLALRDFIKEKGIKHVQFLKIDVEGADFLVLKGLDFNECRPEVILVEFEDKKTENLPFSKEDIVDILHGNGYTLYASIWEPITRYGVNHKFSRVEEYPFNIQPNEWGNFIAVDDRNSSLKEALTALSNN